MPQPDKNTVTRRKFGSLAILSTNKRWFAEATIGNFVFPAVTVKGMTYTCEENRFPNRDPGWSPIGTGD